MTACLTTDTHREWVKFEFCCDDDLLADAILHTETALARTNQKVKHPYLFGIKNTSDIEFVWQTVSEYDKKLPENIRELPRWRMIYLRALTDLEISKNDGFPSRSEKCRAAFRELYEMYYSSEETHRWVCPPISD